MSQTKAELVNGLSVNAAAADAITVDSSGQMGLGVTPNTNLPSNGDFKFLQVGTGASLFGRGSGDEDRGGIAVNYYHTGSAEKYLANGNASGVLLSDGDIDFFNAAANSSGANAAMSKTTAMRIDSSGRVLIGVSASYANASIDELQVGNNNSSNQSGITIGSTDECAIAFADAADARAGSITYTHAANTMIFKTAGQNERMRLRTTTGGLMVGGSGSNRIGEPMLHVKHGGSSENVASFFFDSSDDRDALLIRHNGASGGTSRGMINFLNSSGNGVGHIHATGSGVTYNSVSDYRLKENVVAISDGITRLKTLKPSRFNFIADAETTVDGFIAHEITAVPEAVRGTKDETQSVFYRDDDEIPEGKNVGDVKETVPKYQEIDQAKLIPLLTAALQEEIGKREVLEARVATLEAA